MADAGRLVNGAWMPAVDANGYPIFDAYLRVYTNRTSTLATIYADQALTVPLPNPIDADSSGQFPPIWQDSALFFSMEFGSTSTGPIGTVDDLQPSTNIGGASNKLDRDGGNPAPDLLTNIGAAPSSVTTFDDTLDEQKRLVTSKLRDIVNAQDGFDFAAARAVDARTSLETLFANRVEGGGPVVLPAGDIYVSGLNIPTGVKVVGAGTRPGEEQIDRTQNKYGTTIWLDPAGTITVQNMAWLEGVRILNPKLSYPKLVSGVPDATVRQIRGLDPYLIGPFAGKLAGINQFSGTAITIGGDDTMVRDCLVIGFNKAYYSAAYSGSAPNLPGPSRQNVDGLYFDCTNGIDITNCWDIPRVRNCNAWNFFCSHILADWILVNRVGVAYNFHDHVDGLMMTNCFGLGWDFTYRFKDIYAAQVTGCTGDGAVDTSVASLTGAGLITEGSVYGLHLVGVRCDGNVTNFKFNHAAGMVDGKIAVGNTSNGRFIEVGAYSNGLTLDVTIAGAAVEAVRIRDGARNIQFNSITGYLLSDVGEIIRFDTPADIRNVTVGPMNIEVGGAGVNSYGVRFRDKVIAGGNLAAYAETRGAASGPVQVAAMSASEASIDIEARGMLPDASVVGITRRTLAGVRQVLARFDAANIVPASWLFRSSSTGSLDLIAEGAATDVGIRAIPKGGGLFDIIAPARIGANAANFITMLGAGLGSAVEIVAQGASANVPLRLSGQGNGGVALLDAVEGTRYQLARFARSSDIAANLVVNAASDTSVVVATEGGGTNVTLAVAGKGTGGVRLDTGPSTYETDAAAAAAGIPVGSTYVMAAGYLRKRLV